MTPDSSTGPHSVPFGAWVKQRRKELDMTQIMLAHQLGYAVSSLRKLEAGRLQPSRQFAEQLADALQLTQDERARFLRAARGHPSVMPSAEQRASQEAPAHPVAHQAHLPAQTTPLLGRNRDVADIAAMLRAGNKRLLTLMGPGGIGKTRLAVAVAEQLRDDFKDGVWFIALGALSDISLVEPTIAQTIGLVDAGAMSIHERLLAYARDAEALLVLDNFEHLVTARDVVASLLAAGAHLKIMCTSRRVVGVYGEHVVPVVPLPLPDLDALSTGIDRGASPVLELFAQRAQAVKPDFHLDAANTRTIAEICRRLEGIPLAIELAAARSKVLSPATILERLSRPLDLLVGGPLSAPTRQQTMRTTLDWSYTLLPEHEQQLLGYLSVFAGGFTVQAAAAVSVYPATAPDAVLNGITSLLDSSLIQHQDGKSDEPRFTMLETIRDYAAERLIRGNSGQHVHQQHAMYFLAYAQRAERELVGPEQVAWLDHLNLEHDNLRAALRWANEQHAVDLAVGLAVALGRFWWLRGHLQEGKQWLAQAAGLATGVAPALRAKARYWEGILTIQSGEFGNASVLLEESRTLYQLAEDDFGLGLALNALGVVANRTRAYTDARRAYEQALALYRNLNHEERIATVLNNLGFTLLLLDDVSGARPLLDESLRLAHNLGDVQGEAFALNNLGFAALKEGAVDEAESSLRRSLMFFWKLGDRRSCAECLELFADVLLQRGQRDSARRALLAADRLRLHIGAPRAVYEQERYARLVSALGDEYVPYTPTTLRSEATVVEDVVLMLIQSAQ